MAKILVADDIKDMRILLHAIFKKWGHEILLAESGQQVLDQIEKHPDVELAFLDINMPDLTGIEAVKKIKELDPDTRLKICFVSGERDKKTVLAALDAGGNDYIVKPVDPSILKEKLEKLLGTAEEEKFATLQLRAKAELIGFPVPVDFWVIELSEVHLIFQSTIPFEEGGMLELKSSSISNAVGEETIFPCRVTKVSKVNDIHSVNCSFIGIHESTRKKIRSIVVKSCKIDDREAA